MYTIKVVLDFCVPRTIYAITKKSVFIGRSYMNRTSVQSFLFQEIKQIFFCRNSGERGDIVLYLENGQRIVINDVSKLKEVYVLLQSKLTTSK
jgi:hypothetical protein